MKILRKTFSKKKAVYGGPTSKELDKASKDSYKLAVPIGALIGAGTGAKVADNVRVSVHNDKVKKVGKRIDEIVSKAQKGDPASIKLVNSIGQKRDQFWNKVRIEADKAGRKAGKKKGTIAGVAAGLATTGLLAANGYALKKDAKKAKEKESKKR